MEGPMKELNKLEQLTSNASSAKSKSVEDSLDSLLQYLQQVQDRLKAGTDTQDTFANLTKTVEARKKDVDDRQKEIYNSLARYGKALDKKFTSSLPASPPIFDSPEATQALERTAAVHFLRTGQFKVASTFMEECGTDVAPSVRSQFIDLHQILQWTRSKRTFLQSRSSPLEFYLHRSQFMRLLLASHPPQPLPALQYAHMNFPPFYEGHMSEINRLMTCPVFLPLATLQRSPYANLASPAIHLDLEPMFAKEYCASMGLSRQVPLRVVGDIGGGGALARIEKGRKLMRERKSEWSQTNELPIEIPLPPENRYHSIFACPVSKEQSTDQNPPMMMSCGHVIAKDSLQKLSRNGGSLAGLTVEQIDFIEAVITRAGPTSTKFPVVFKAYNDILQERGLDPQNEVVLYRKLLKLGTLKGQNWGEKWKVVKQLHSCETHARPLQPIQPRVVAPLVKTSTPMITRLALPSSAPPKIEDDAFTLHSHEADTQETITEEETDQTGDIPQYHNSRVWVQRESSATDSTTAAASNSLGLDLGPSPSPAPWQKPAKPVLAQHSRPYSFPGEPALTEMSVDIAPSTSTTPPSRVIIHGEPVVRYVQQATAAAPWRISRQPSPPPVKLTAAQRVAQAKERRVCVINEDDAWAKIKMERDEKEADKFREERLVEKCWDVWRQGHQWIITTHEQIAQARDNLVLRLAIHRWRSKLLQRREAYEQVAMISDNKTLRLAMIIWRQKMQEKKREQWRQDMRAKMKSVREKRETQLVEDAWAKWRQSHQSHFSGRHYNGKLIRRFFKLWTSKLVEVEHMEAAAEEFSTIRESKAAGHVWHQWRRATELKLAERTVVERTGLRVMSDALSIWKRQMHDYHTAQEFHDSMVVKTFFRSWKTARDRIRSLERRGDKHLARQDDILVRAVLRVWKAHERGKLLERVKKTRLLKQTWALWKMRILTLKERENTAISFSTRPDSSLAISGLRTWYQVYRTHKNAQAFAVQYHSAQLTFKMLHIWRIQLRVRLKMIKQAKIAEKFFLMRRAWRHWHDTLEEQRRQKKLKLLEQRMLLHYFDRWIQRTREQRHCKLAEGYIQDLVAKRVMGDTLSHWINRVVDVKDREILVSQRYQQRLLFSAFAKWKNIRARHVEDLSLMESYQDVKREETIRRTFHKWLSVARATRHRRKVLQEKEAEIKLASLASAWDKWRDRFKDEKLRPIRNTLFRAFGIWHSRTRSLPAIRFHASNLKAKAWEKWRAAMPVALQARQAREKHRKAVLSTFMDKWMQKYKTKIELKAVA
ncbi:hypothetical protein NEOLEDRAFT_1155765 [Neolentinus lepideus HHB14362 ss-1]|uniref:GID complex catalytic subunit 2 n=1 Tax=Neolentinus lepideus HHB14362 ss-1 TaxID=1314782 RepID=A0A165T7H4_9AGAM|nr:hypothetical protein NEOLEDRAFT_1155765 [Neolentinus lepideus HHB14362 ss-1]